MNKKAIFFTVILFCVFFISASSIAEEITLTTYYPAPYGNYEELQATMLAIGSSETMPSGDGDLNVAGDIDAAGAVDAGSYSVSGSAGDSGTFTSNDGKTIIVTNGIITSITP